MSDSTPAPALPGSPASLFELLKGAAPEGDAWAPIAVMAYAFVQNSDLELPEFLNLEGMDGMAPLVVLLGVLFFAARYLLKKRFDALEQQIRALRASLDLDRERQG